MQSLLIRSKEEKLKLEMIYMTGKGELSQRVIRVINVYDHSILAYCFTRRKVRKFTNKNILSVLPYRKKRHIGA